jgi:hypothetical protein
MTFALNGLAIGLGVLYPNLKEANPNKIVSGFGGTLCFVLSSFYILASVLLLVFGAAGLHSRAGWAVEGIGGFVLLSLGIGWLPLKLGSAAVEKLRGVNRLESCLQAVPVWRSSPKPRKHGTPNEGAALLRRQI